MDYFLGIKALKEDDLDKQTPIIGEEISERKDDEPDMGGLY